MQNNCVVANVINSAITRAHHHSISREGNLCVANKIVKVVLLVQPSEAGKETSRQFAYNCLVEVNPLFVLRECGL
jgi:hypothetical protein